MKKIFSLLLATFAFVAVVPSFVACENEDEDVKQGPQITLTTSMEVGDAIILRFNRDNVPTKVIGAEKIHETHVDMDGGYFESWCVDITYKITSQTIILKGNFVNLRCQGNELVGLDVSECPGLSLLQCEYNQLTTLDVSKNSKLEWLACASNNLTTLDTSKNSKLEILSCANNKLTSLDISNNKLMYNLDCSNNRIKAAEMSKIIKSLRDWKYATICYPSAFITDHATLSAVSDNSTEGNEISEEDVKIAQDKNWRFE